jgi:integrase
MSKNMNNFGIRRRELQRHERAKKLEEEIGTVIAPYLKLLSSNWQDKGFYDELCQTALQAAFKKIGTNQGRIIASQLLAEEISKGNEEGAWDLPIPIPYQTFQRFGSYRGEKWFIDQKHLQEIDWQIICSLEAHAFRDWTPELVVGGLLYFVATRDLLCTPEGLVSFCHVLGSEKALKYLEGIGTFVELSFQKNGFPTNTRVEGQETSTTPWFIGGYVLALIARINKFDGSSLLRSINERKAIKYINLFIQEFSAIASKFDHLNSFLKVAPALFESKARLPNFLYRISVGDVKSSALSKDAWHYFLNPVLHNYRNEEDRKAIQLVHAKHHTKGRDEKLVREYEALGYKLRKLFRKDSDKTNKQVIEELRWLEKDWESQIATKVILRWFIHRFEDLKPGSARRYYSEVFWGWVIQLSDANIDQIQSEDFTDYYQRIIDGHESPEERKRTSQRLQDIHNFAVTEFHFPALIEPLWSGDSIAPFVRAWIVPEQLYNHVLNIISTDNIFEQSVTLGIRLLVILAFRLGLRIGELVGLRVCDVIGQPGWYRLHVTNYSGHDLKSPSAQRKITIGCFLTEEENQFFEDYYAERFRVCQSRDELLFVSEVNHNLMWDSSFVSNQVGRILKNVSGRDEFVFHSFRHSALSRMQLVIEKEWKLLNRISPFDKAQGKRMREELTGAISNDRDGYNSLAIFAGHLSPHTTAQTYLHLTPLIIAKKVFANNELHNATFIENLSGLSPQIVARIMEGSKGVTSKKWISRALKELTPQIGKKYSLSVGSANFTYDLFSHIFQHNKIEYKDVATLLEKLDAGTPVDQISRELNIDQDRISFVYRAAYSIADKKTRQKRSSVISKKRAGAVAPARLKSRAEEWQAWEILSQLLKRFSGNLSHLEGLSLYALKRSNSQNSAIRFYDLNKFARFLWYFSQIIDPSFWRLQIKVRPNLSEDEKEQLLKKWKSIAKFGHIECTGGLGENTIHKDGVGYLKLQHPDALQILAHGKIQGKTYSSGALRWVFHMLAIILAAQKEQNGIISFENASINHVHKLFKEIASKPDLARKIASIEPQEKHIRVHGCAAGVVLDLIANKLPALKQDQSQIRNVCDNLVCLNQGKSLADNSVLNNLESLEDLVVKAQKSTSDEIRKLSMLAQFHYSNVSELNKADYLPLTEHKKVPVSVSSFPICIPPELEAIALSNDFILADTNEAELGPRLDLLRQIFLSDCSKIQLNEFLLGNFRQAVKLTQRK